MVSHELRCVFLHPNKCGGKSIERAIWGVQPAPGSADHRTLRQHRKKHGSSIAGYFVFMFCRNPWDRLVSIYHGRKQILKVEMPTFREFVKSANPGKSPTMAQVEWIRGEEALEEIDFVGRLESYEQDWREVCRRLGIDRPLPHVNRSAHAPYPELYDSRTRKLVARKYREDIERFGYEFGA